MRHGRFMGYGFYGSYILFILVILIITSLIIFVLYKQKKNCNFEDSIENLKERFARDEISADEFKEKRSVIDGLHVSNQVLIQLVDRYVKGKITSKEFFSIMKQIEK